jgi:transcriptional regulator of acetoin/glycerol metabolism
MFRFATVFVERNRRLAQPVPPALHWCKSGEAPNKRAPRGNNMLLTADDRLNRARIVLERRGLAAEDLLPRTISESWKRCLALGLDPLRPPALTAVDEFTVRRACDRLAVLHRLVRAEMENLYQQIAGSHFMIAFADPDGMLLDTICDATFSETARTSSIRPGTIWTEGYCGTNALGTAGHIGAPVTVHGSEHFFGQHGGLTCTAVPLFSADGKLAGVLDASSDCRNRQQHTQALVSMAAAQIENGLFRESHRGDVIVAFHSRAEYLHTLSAGLLAMQPDGLILSVNARGRFLLQGLPASSGRRFGELFRTGLGDFLSAGRDDDRQRLEDRVGSVFAARLETMKRTEMRPVPTAPARARAGAATRVAGFVAQDAAVTAVLARVEAAAQRRLPILIRGQTGTGKEQLARYAHQVSGRSGGFVPVNCAGLPESLIEAELFGHIEGAFTGARRGGAPGLVAESDGGTLFLDEIGDMKASLQSVLLRLLDDWTIRPVGGGKSRRVETLLVAATNVDLDAAVAAGRFRPDLLYRINMVDVTLPPLRDRTDFAAIAARLLADIAPRAVLTEQAAAALARRPWPGNIRELRSELTRLTLTDMSRVIDAADLAELPRPPTEAELPRGLRAMLSQRVRSLHHELNGNVAETARRLGVSRNTVYRVLQQGP